MTITLELTQKQEFELKRKATERGLDVKSYILEVATGGATPKINRMSVDEFNVRLDELAQDGPGLPDEALTSEGIYQDHP